RRSVDAGVRSDPTKLKKTVANRAATTVGGLRNTLRVWFNYYNGYDPLFTWWMDEPYKAVDQSLANYATYLNERVTGVRGGVAPAIASAGGTNAGGAGGGRGGGGGGG